MLRFIKLVALALIMIAIVLMSLANSGPVTLHLLPEGPIRDILPVSTVVPLYVVILGSVLVGLMIGYILEWLREAKHRREARLRQREAKTLAAEVDKLKQRHMTEEEQVLEILDSAPRNA